MSSKSANPATALRISNFDLREEGQARGRVKLETDPAGTESAGEATALDSGEADGVASGEASAGEVSEDGSAAAETAADEAGTGEDAAGERDEEPGGDA